MKQKKPVKAHVTTIQEYSQLVISCMQRGRRMNTTEVAKSILPFVSPKTTKLVPTWRMRLGVDRKCASSRRGRAQGAEGNPAVVHLLQSILEEQGHKAPVADIG